MRTTDNKAALRQLFTFKFSQLTFSFGVACVQCVQYLLGNVVLRFGIQHVIVYCTCRDNQFVFSVFVQNGDNGIYTVSKLLAQSLLLLH